MEHNEIQWDDLPSELQTHIIGLLDLVAEPSLFLTVKLISKHCHNICSTESMLKMWYHNNFSAHLPSKDPVVTMETVLANYIREITSDTLYMFTFKYDLEILARRLYRQQMILETPMVTQGILLNDAVNCLKVFISNEHGPNHVISMGRTLLHSACFHNALKCAKVLLQMGANVNAIENTWQQTPLHVATQRSGIAMIKLLLEYKANMLVQDKDLLTPLKMCILYGVPEVKQFAKQYKAAHGLE